jgi:cysteinyl-tRNA synthetase
MTDIPSFYNTFSRQIEPLQCLSPNTVKLYCCGPTVYNYQHIGNLRTYIFEDVLARSLRFLGYTVEHVMNITDVGHLASDADDGEDKMAIAMKREKKKSYEIAEFYTNIFFEDCAKIGVKRPDIVCKATDHIQEMIDLIKTLEDKGFTYVSNGNVYFDISKSEDYGKLALLDLEKLKAGARIEIDSNKKNPQDFVLWFTKSKFENQELQWDSPWGTGYPGWHIECSAMATKYLGEQFDIHCGGIDHIPVHHTNEIAQSEAASGKNWVKIWMHGEFLLINAEKMAKSSGNFFRLADIEAKGIDPIVYRFFCLGSHYRSQLNFTWETLENAQNSFNKIRSQVLRLKSECTQTVPVLKSEDLSLVDFKKCLCDDLSMPKALALVSGTLNDKQLSAQQKLSLIYAYDQVLGLGCQNWTEEIVEISPEVQALLGQRRIARDNRDWKASDELRDKIKALGFEVKDKGAEQEVKRV